jgi:lysophospholipase L1-like esterase
LIDLVGSRHKHNNDKAEPDSYQFDPDHEGHWGKDSAWIAENLSRLLERNVPDVAVIHLGAEDIVASHAAAEPLTDGIVRNIGRVIAVLRSKNPNVRFVVAKAIPKKGREEVTDLLNKKILLLARSSASTLQPVVVAEIDRGFDSIDDTCDGGIFPTAGGARKIAAMLAEAINPLLGGARRE